MQRITNCVLLKDDQILLLQKPSRNWWVAPGGKMEVGESIKESVIREYFEETGIHLKHPTIKGIFTILIKEDNHLISEWMMFTFVAKDFEGVPVNESREGKVSWVPVKDALKLPMAPGDYHILQHCLNGKEIAYGTFTYTPDYKLLDYRLDPS